MRLFFLTPALIGPINDRILIVTNQKVVLIGLTLFICYFDEFIIQILFGGTFFFLLFCKGGKTFWQTFASVVPTPSFCSDVSMEINSHLS